MTGKPRKGLSGTDKALWDKVTDSVTPLDGRPDAPDLPKIPRSFYRPIAERPLPAAWTSGNAGSQKPDTNIQRKERRRLEKGHLHVDRTLDLHGLTQDQAWNRLKRQLEMAARHGNRSLLVITGKGGKRWAQNEKSAAWRTRDEFDQFGGVLKAKVPIWLESPELAPLVRSYGPAAPSHGGEGALYVMLRRQKPAGGRL